MNECPDGCGLEKPQISGYELDAVTKRPEDLAGIELCNENRNLRQINKSLLEAAKKFLEAFRVGVIGDEERKLEEAIAKAKP